jgi:hypothetical protein
LLLVCCLLTLYCAAGSCLDLVGESRRVTERIAAHETDAQGTESLWSNPRHRRAIVILQDRAQHIGEAVDGCRMFLTTVYSIMLPYPLPRYFRQLLETFWMSQRVHLLIKLNMIAGANFALGWMQKWHPRLNYDAMSQSLPSRTSYSWSSHGCDARASEEDHLQVTTGGCKFFPQVSLLESF